MKIHYENPTGIFPTGFNPMHQTPLKGKIPQDPNPAKFLWNSCESKEALVAYLSDHTHLHVKWGDAQAIL